MRAMQTRDNFVAGLPALLALCGKSQEHVTRTIKRCCGVTPTEFVNQIRLRDAARLLRDTTSRVQPIALEAGFGNMSHFLALFRHRYGCSPREYRRQQRMVTDPVELA
jgi:AraC family cel operon transcriptional repressor